MRRQRAAEGSPRVAYDARYVRDSYGGIARFASCLLSALVRLESGATFVVYYDPDQQTSRFPLAEVMAQPNVLARPVRLPLHSPQEQLTWPVMLARDRVDLFYTPYFALPLLARKPLVCTVHDTIFEHFPAYSRGRWVRAYYRPMMRLGLRRAAAVFAVSQATKADLVSLYGVQPGRITVVPEAAAHSFRPVVDAELAAEVRRRLRLPDRYILAIGARRPHKNLGAAVRAFTAVQSEVPHSLVLVGRAEARYRDDVAEALADVGPVARVYQLPEVAEADLPVLYGQADALLMPSLHEGFGLPVLEAMACGTPVVAADRAALPEVVGQAGLLVDVSDPGALGDALRRVLGDEALRSEMKRRGLARAAEFSWSRSAAIALGAFRRVVPAKSS